MENYKVYIHTNKYNNMRYIGITKQEVLNRWNSGNGYQQNKLFYNDILKYGWEEGFIHEIVCENLNEKEALSNEAELISLFHSDDPKYGYNQNKGSNYNIGNKYNLSGQKQIPIKSNYKTKVICLENNEIFDSMAEASKEMGIPDYQIQVCCKGKIKSTDGYHFQKYANYIKGDIIDMSYSNKHEIEVVCIETNETFSSITEAGIKYNINPSYIGLCCSGKKEVAGNMHWKYFDENMIPQKYNIDKSKRRILCMDTGVIYKNAKDIERIFGFKSQLITKCCRNITGSSCGYQWQYVE